MKLKLSTIWNQAFHELTKAKCKPKLGYRISKILRQVKPELLKLEAQRIALVEKYADPQSPEDIKNTKKNVTIKVKEFMDEFNILLDSEIELDIQKIPFQMLNGELKLSAEDLLTIGDLFELPE